MSLLTFIHERDSALILTDTLATMPEGEPFMFQSKAWAIPHLNMAVAVTGVTNLGGKTERLSVHVTHRPPHRHGRPVRS